ncbi:hypothetical protein ACQP2T_61640 [Nonomuraea sp. CA-143628]|uniref:hypothetical protein n=1 Tax=Nonomuraea sp. CA-143628 TaxID=3239997 RepID=UPI003D909207
MRFASLTCVFATLVALAVGCLFILPAAANAAPAESGQITSPIPGAALTTGKPVTAKAVVTDACTATLTLRTPAGDKTNLAKESGTATCLGEIALTATFTPDKPGDYTLTVIGSVPLSEVSLTATAAPSPTPTVTVTETTTPSASPSASTTPSASPTPTATVTKTVTPKASATPKKSATAKPRVTTTATVKVTEPAPATAQQPTVNYVPAVPTTTPSGTDPNEDTPLQTAAPVTTVTAQPDYAALLAFQNMAANSSNGSLWDAVLPVVTILVILAALAVAAWIGFKTFRKRGRHH